MIDSRMCEQLLRRLGSLDWYPRDEEGHKDLAHALLTARTDAIALYVVNEWIRNNADAPKPAELYSAVAAENERYNPDPLVAQEEDWKRQQSSGNCAKCRGFGIAESKHVDDLDSIAVYCSCSMGRDRERLDCSLGRCRAENANISALQEIPRCCSAPWKINKARATLRDRFGSNPIKRNGMRFRREPKKMESVAQVAGGDEYHGDF